MPISEISFFIFASILLIITPGPDLIFLIAQSLNNGAKAGLATALGLASGNLFHTLATALVIAVILRSFPFAFETLKILGVIYLLYLAYQTAFSKSENKQDLFFTEGYPLFSLYLKGVLMNVLNPKVALFFLAFLPQFISSNSTSAWKEMIILGLIFTLLVVVIFGIIAYYSGKLKEKFPNNNKSHYLKWMTAGIFIFLALRLLFIQQ